MEIKVKEVKEHTRRFPRGRAYAATWREYYGRTIVYFDVEGESVWDNLANRRRRPKDEYRKHMPVVLEQLGLPDDTKFRWNDRAGCKMCPCSPGFVLDQRVTRDDGRPIDVWVTITGEEHPADYDPAAIAAQVINCEIVQVPS